MNLIIIDWLIAAKNFHKKYMQVSFIYSIAFCFSVEHSFPNIVKKLSLKYITLINEFYVKISLLELRLMEVHIHLNIVLKTILEK